MSFEAGAHLWVVADLESSGWAQRLDWYLNFQIQRAFAHEPPEKPSELTDVIQQWEFDEPRVPSSDRQAPLMIASSNLLPNHATVVVPLKKDHKAWVSQIFETWKKLGQPSFRVFLPRGMASRDFTSNWPGEAVDLEGVLVAE